MKNMYFEVCVCDVWVCAYQRERAPNGTRRRLSAYLLKKVLRRLGPCCTIGILGRLSLPGSSSRTVTSLLVVVLRPFGGEISTQQLPAASASSTYFAGCNTLLHIYSFSPNQLSQCVGVARFFQRAQCCTCRPWLVRPPDHAMHSR